MKRPSSFLIVSICPAALLAACSQAPQAKAPAVTASEAPAPAPAVPITTVAPVTAAVTAEPADRPKPSREPDVIFVPTPYAVVDQMLEVANVGPKDVLYDLGSGDGRIPIVAAKRWGTRGVGVDIDPLRIREANQAARAANVTGKVEFIEGDLFETDLSKATVVTLYLLPMLNLKLRPRLLELKPGTRIVSHNYNMGDWAPEKTIAVGGSTVYYWTVPKTQPVHLR